MHTTTHPEPHFPAAPGRAPGGPPLLVLSQHFYPDLSATGQVLTLLCEELAALGVRIEALCAPSTIPDPEVDERSVTEHRGIAINRIWGTRLPKGASGQGSSTSSRLPSPPPSGFSGRGGRAPSSSSKHPRGSPMSAPCCASSAGPGTCTWFTTSGPTRAYGSGR